MWGKVVVSKPVRVAENAGMANRRPIWLVPLLACLAAFLSVGLSLASPGIPDRSFGTGGKVTTRFEGPTGPQVSIAIGSNGRIVAAGSVEGHGFGLARFRANGRLDPTFSGDGRTTLNFDTDGVGASAVGIDHEGRIVIGGTVQEVLEPAGFPPKTTYWFAVARLNRDGTPDTTFSGDGLQVTRIGVAAELHAIAIDRQDRIVAVGSSATNDEYYDVGYAVARYLSGGHLDHSFSGDGVFTGRFGRLPDGPANAVAIDGRGRIVVGGCAVDGAPTPHTRYTRFALVRLTSSGRRDRSFSGNGEVRTMIGNHRASISDLVIDGQGRIVAAGNSRYATVARYLPTGRLDPSFAGDGKAVPDLSLRTAAVALDRSGRIVLGGNVEGYFPIAWAVARLHGDGSLDRAFGDGAAVETPGWNVVSDVAIDLRGRTVAAGIVVRRGELGTLREFALERYTSD
jgi:uncharacterized delta-60 repeat protein